MRACRKNKQKLIYARIINTVNVPQTDSDGNTIYDLVDGEYVPRMIAEPQTEYSTPVTFYGNIHSSGGQAEAEFYGVSTADYDAVLYMPKGSIDLDETCAIWYGNTPEYKTAYVQTEDGLIEKTESGDPITIDTASLGSADYTVVRVPPCLDERVYLLKRVDK